MSKSYSYTVTTPAPTTIPTTSPAEVPTTPRKIISTTLTSKTSTEEGTTVKNG